MRWTRGATLGILVLLAGAAVAPAAPPSKQPTLSVDDVVVTEGDSGTSAATFTVSLSAGSSKTVTVDFATADGTATAADYAPVSGTLVFAKGQTAKAVAVAVKGDTAVEPDETFALRLSNASNAVIADGSGEATILNDDAPPPPPATHTLSVSRDGNGTGAVTSDPAGINCGSDCSEDYPVGTTITLTAAAAPGSAFTGWSGACAGAGTCTVTMDQARAVTAAFSAASTVNHTLTVELSGIGTGTVTSSPAGIFCSNIPGGFTDCAASFAAGTRVVLTATPWDGGIAVRSCFSRWEGDGATDPAERNTRVVQMDGGKRVVAVFGISDFTGCLT